MSKEKDLIELCAKRVESFAMSLELQRHIGLPDPIEAVMEAARRIRAIIKQETSEGDP